MACNDTKLKEYERKTIAKEQKKKKKTKKNELELRASLMDNNDLSFDLERSVPQITEAGRKTTTTKFFREPAESGTDTTKASRATTKVSSTKNKKSPSRNPLSIND